ncbi:MAG: protocatechuate dioxygenase [Actinomycetota bacterium]
MDAALPDRRTFLIGASALVAAACSGGADGGGGDTGATPTTTAAADGVASTTTADPSGTADGLEPLTAAAFAALPICAVPPATTAGPFPTIEQLDRRDVTEGYPGHPLRLGIRVVDETCEPIPGAEVEIWHADATGDYSSFVDGGSGKDEGEGTTFCRGFQTANADGILEFQTIYPGWYEGRAVHIHVRARVGGDQVLTSQLYFDEAYTEAVYASSPYAEFGSPDTSWASDGIAVDPGLDGSGIVLTEATTHNGAGSLGLVNLGLPV